MATHDYVIANDTAANVRADLNNALAAIVSNNSGATAPATTYANQWWYDSTNDILKIRNEADTGWIDVVSINQSTGQVDRQEIGVDQTWQDVSASRTNSTSYQNTTGRPIMVAIGTGTTGTTGQEQVSVNNSTWIDVGVETSTAGSSNTFIVPNNWYYRLNSNLNITHWSELR